MSTSNYTHSQFTDIILRISRWLVFILGALAAAMLVAGIWLFPDYVTANPDSFLPTQAWTPETLAAAVAQLGWSPRFLPWNQLAHDVINFMVYFTLGIILLVRGPRSWFGIFAAMTFVFLGYSNSVVRVVAPEVPAIGVLSSVIGQLAWQLIFVLFYVFPNGRFVPSWTRWLVLGWIGLNVFSLSGVFFLFSITDSWWLPVPLVLSTIGSQVYRFFRRSDPVQRAQTKWIVYVLFLGAPLMLAYGYFVPLTPAQAPPSEVLGEALRTTIFWGTISWAYGLLIPLAIGIAILRYRLWDIDLLIRKTLVYTVLTASLGLVYFGSIILLQTAVGRATGEQSPLIIVFSTLLIAALFTPLRRRIQNFIDRRFFRQKYDAVQTLARFSQTARDEVDLWRLTAELVRMVETTIKPNSVVVWLKDDKVLRSAGSRSKSQGD